MDKQFIETFTIEGKEHNYVEFLESISNHFNKVSNKPLFTTSTEGLFDTFINNLPTEAQQHYTCRACRKFVENFGGLVTISEDGSIQSALWHSDVPPYFKKSVKAMKSVVEKSRVSGVFISDVATLGLPITGQWKHLSVELPTSKVNSSRLKNAYQLIAEKREDFRILVEGLLNYSLDVVEQAVAILDSEALYRSDRFLGVAKFVLDLHTKRNGAKNSRLKDNITWLAVATSPTSYTHFGSSNSMIATLLDDIKDGLPFETINANFEKKMETYMRSTATPTENAIYEAEKTVRKLGIEKSLDREYPKFEDIPNSELLWEDKQRGKRRETVTIEESGGGIFGHIVTKEKQQLSGVSAIGLPKTVMTWDKFQRTILPTVDKIEAMVDNPNRLMAMVKATDESSPNIFQWNNPFSWYYHAGIDGEIKKRVEQAGGRYENNEIRVSLIWEGLTDLDLHCVTPLRGKIDYNNKRSRCGGYLDLDMNGLDRNSETPVENMRWVDNAPQGRYQFYVKNFNERVNFMSGTSFRVELEINGKTYHYEGKPLRTKEQVTVFEFEYTKGQEPRFISTPHSSISSASDWNIPVNEFVEVRGITTSPNLWGDKPVSHIGTHIFFLLDGCKDMSEGKSKGFFNEMLKPELRGIRKVLEAYTSATPIRNVEESSASGLGYSKDNEWNLILRVTTGNNTRIIKIDRWD